MRSAGAPPGRQARFRRNSGVLLAEHVGLGRVPNSSAPGGAASNTLDPQVLLDARALGRQCRNLAFCDPSGAPVDTSFEAQIGGGAFGRTWKQ